MRSLLIPGWRWLVGSPKRWFFWVLLFLLLYAIAEGSSLLTLQVLEGNTYSASRYSRERKELAHVARRRVEDPTSTTAYVVHPYVGNVFNPNWPKPLEGENPVTEFGYCNSGSLIHKRDPGKVIIGVVGGSVASKFTCLGGEHLKECLRTSPSFADKELVVVNFALAGHKQPQQVMSLMYALSLGCEFDLLLNIDGFNEVTLYPSDNWAKGIFPLFPRGWHFTAASLPDPTSRRLLGQMTYYEEEREDWAVRFQGWGSFSPTWNLIWYLRDRSLANRAQRCAVALAEHKPDKRLPYAATGPWRYFRSEEELYAELVAIWKRCSLILQRVCQGHGIRYYHFLQPNQYDPGSKELTAEERKKAWQEFHTLRRGAEKGYPRLRLAGQALREEGVRFHDLSRIFVPRKETVYNDPCCHLNQRGNELLAEAIADVLMETAEPPRSHP